MITSSPAASRCRSAVSAADSVSRSTASSARASSFDSMAGTSVIALAASPRNVHGSQIARMHSG